MRRLILVAAALPSIAIGCGRATPTQRPELKLTKTHIPKDVLYTILDAQTEGRAKRMVSVSINKKVTEGILRSIALDIKNAVSDSYTRTRIDFYLPQMKGNAASWATAFFTPELKLTIHGITKEQETQMLHNTPPRLSGDIIGRWLQDEDPFPGKITLVSDATGISMEKIYQDGNTGRESMVEQPTSTGRKFMRAGRTGPENDYFLIDPSGNLQIWSQDIDGSHVLAVTALKID